MGDKELSGFNVLAAKKHIKQLLKDKGIRHKTAYEYLKLTQPDFSKRLSEKDEKTFFQIWQLWDLSNLLNCSIDELLGKNDIPQKKANSPEDVSLSDVCAALYYFHQIVQPEYDQAKDGKRVFISSSIPAVNELIRKFSYMKDEPEVLSYFSQGFIRDHRNVIRKYDFETEYEYGRYDLDKILQSDALLSMATDIIKNNSAHYKIDNFRTELTTVYELLDKKRRICAYNAIPQYIKENNIVEGSAKNLILCNFQFIHENQLNE